MLLHVLRHVECDECAVVAEQEFGERFCEFCFTNTCWPEEDERTAWTLRVFQPGTSTADALAHSLDGIFLADDALVQLGFHVEKLRCFFFGEFVHGNTRPQAQYFGDRFFVYFIEKVNARSLNIGFF